MAFRTFGTWLKVYKNDDSALGDLADDMLRDCSQLRRTPSYFKTPQMLLSRMRMNGACSAAIAVLKEAAEAYGQPLELDEEDEDDYDY
jgi:hypothetical protein